MKIALISLVLLAFAVVPVAYLMFYGMAEVRSLVIREVDLSRVADGTYTGAYHKGRWTYDVEVVVQSHRIVSVKNLNARMNVVKDWNARAEALILQKQAIKLDVISGASINTRAFEKAVEVALTTPQPR